MSEGSEPVFALFISRPQGVRKDAVFLCNVSSAREFAVAADAVKGRKGPERLGGAIALLAIALLSTVLLSTVALTVALAVLHHHRASQLRRPHEQLSFRRERAHDACRLQYGCREHGICETANHAGLWLTTHTRVSKVSHSVRPEKKRVLRVRLAADLLYSEWAAGSRACGC